MTPYEQEMLKLQREQNRLREEELRLQRARTAMILAQAIIADHQRRRQNESFMTKLERKLFDW